MTYQEPERLALQLNELMERRNALRAVLNRRLQDVLTDEERRDIQRVIALIDTEMAQLESRLADLRRRPAGG